MPSVVEQARFGVDYQPRFTEHTAMLTVSGVVTFRQAPELRRRLLDAIAAHADGNLVVDLGQVEKLDTAAMAVLLEGLRIAGGRGPAMFLVGASKSVTSVFRLAGFEDALLRCFGCLADVQLQLAG